MDAPRPVPGLHDIGPPPFLTKTYDIVDDLSTNHIVSWSRDNNSFVVWDPQSFAMTLLPKYFKHNNFSSFVRQLNTYGFRKVDPDRWEFANEGFLRGQKHLLKIIRRRKTSQTQGSQQALDPCVEVGRFGLDGEVGRLRRDKQVLMVEMVKLRQQQQNTKACLQAMEERLIKTETKQQQMVSFLARAMKNPSFVQQLVEQKDRRKQLEDAISKKRRRSIDQGPNNLIVGELGQGGGEMASFVKLEPEVDGGISELEVLSELDMLAIDMQGLDETPNNPQQQLMGKRDQELAGKRNKEMDQGFWEDLLDEGMEEEMGLLDFEDGDAENVDVLIEHLGYLGSSPDYRS